MRLAVLETAAHGGLLHYAALADALADRGHDVDLVAARDNELLERRGSARMRAVLIPPTRQAVETTPYLAGSQSGVIHLAMTMARAVVASDVGELGEAVVEGETGRLVPPGDEKALAAVLEEVVSNPALADRLGARRRKRVLDEFGWERAAEPDEAALLEIPGASS